MTKMERDELIEKSLLNELDATDAARVGQLRRDDPAFEEEYTFQKTLIQQVRLRRRQELLDMFAEFDVEASTTTDTDQPAAFPVAAPVTTQEPTAGRPGTIVPLWRRRPVWAAAAVLAVVLGATLIWRTTNRYDAPPVAIRRPDSTHRQSSPDSPGTTAPAVQPDPQGPVARQTTPPARLNGLVQLPYSETTFQRMGLAEDRTEAGFRPVVFSVGPEPAYEFQDTLRVYLPVLPLTKPAWKLRYDRSADTYYLISGRHHYELVKGLRGRKPLVDISADTTDAGRN